MSVYAQVLHTVPMNFSSAYFQFNIEGFEGDDGIFPAPSQKLEPAQETTSKTNQSLPNVGRKIDFSKSRRRVTPGPRARVINDLLQAYDQIENAIFSSLPGHVWSAGAEASSSLSRILSSDLISHWETGLETLSEEYLCGNFTPGGFELILNTVLVGVETLESVRDCLNSDITAEWIACGRRFRAGSQDFARSCRGEVQGT